MTWAAVSVEGIERLFVLPPGKTMNGSKHLELLKNKKELHMNVPCDIFMQEGAPYHKSKTVTNFLKSKKMWFWIGQVTVQT